MLLPKKRCRVAQAVPVILNTAKNLNSHPTELLAGHRGTAGLLMFSSCVGFRSGMILDASLYSA